MMMMMRFYQIFRYTYFTTRHVPVVDVSSVCALSGWIHLPVHTHTHTHTLYIYDQVGLLVKTWDLQRDSLRRGEKNLR